MVSQGDYETPKKLGISHEQISIIKKLTTQDIHRLSSLTHANILSIEFDKSALSIALNIIADRNIRQEEIYEMLKEGASYPVMKYIYGITTSDMAACRKVLNLTKCEGRPSMPSEEMQSTLWRYITPSDIDETDKLAEKLLFASKQTSLKINVIWILLKQWLKDISSSTEDPVSSEISILKSVK
jgi:hypothetical protein